MHEIEVDDLIVFVDSNINLTEEHVASLLVAAKSFTPQSCVGSLGFTSKEIQKPQITVLNSGVVCIKKEDKKGTNDLKALQLSLIEEGKINVILPWPKIPKVQSIPLNTKEKGLFFECLKRSLRMHYIYERVVREWYYRGVS